MTNRDPAFRAAIATEQLTELLTREFARINRKLDAITALLASPQSVHAVEPAPDLELNPVFDHFGREVGDYDDDRTEIGLYPLTATCQCCRQITKTGPAAAWAHCD